MQFTHALGGQREGLANAVAFLLSGEAEAISGTVVDVGCFANQGGPVPARPSTNRGHSHD